MSDWFSGAYKYSLIGSDGNQIACVDGPPPGISSLEETFVPRGGSWSTSVNYESFECFHATTDDAGVTRYDLPGTFRFYHEAFPSDVLEFSIDSVGDLRPRLDMRLQDGIESGP